MAESEGIQNATCDPDIAVGGDDDEGDGGCDDGAVDMEEQMRKEIGSEEMPEGGAGVPLRGKARARQSLTGDLDQLDTLIGVDDDYSYFSKEAARGWAGPAHWTFRKGAGARGAAPLARPTDLDAEAAGEGEFGSQVVDEFNWAKLENTKLKKGAKKKEPFFLDLTGPAPVDMERKMSKSKASIVLKAVKGEKDSENNTLPEDLRYSVDRLRRLFLRPRTRVTLRQGNYYRSSAAFEEEIGGDEEEGDCCAMEDAGEDWGAPKDVSALDAPVMMLQPPRRAQKIDISYARTAKKVDIKALKDDLWTTIDTINPTYKKVSNVKTTEVEFMGNKQQALSFAHTISKLDVTKCPDVSISYAFICLLHLANEKNLAILGDGQQRDEQGGTLCTGNLADLLVIHDP